MQESSQLLYWLCAANPFTHCVEFIRFALYLKLNFVSLAVVLAATGIFGLAAIIGYDPRHGLVRRRTE